MAALRAVQDPPPQRWPARLGPQPLLAQRELAARACREHALGVGVAAPACVPFGRDQHMLAKSGEMTTTQWTAIRRGLAVRRTSHAPPRGGRQPRHRSIVAPLAASLVVGIAATAVLRMGVAVAVAERARRATRLRRARERQFSLLAGERPVEGLKRMILGQLDLAIELLSADDGAVPTAEAVHETRKALKRLRTLMRLLEDELGEDAIAREQALLRDAGRRLASARDSEVLVATLEELLRRHRRKLAHRGGVRRLRVRLAEEREQATSRLLGDHVTRSQVLLDLRGARARMHAWTPPAGDGIRTLEPGLKRLYAQGRRRHRRARKGRGDRAAAMHEWRKRVKDLRYAAEALSRSDSPPHEARLGVTAVSAQGAAAGGPGPGTPGPIPKLARRADRLGERLGEEHDLVLLAQRVRDEGTSCSRGTRRALLKLIDRRRKRLRRRALRDGASLYGLQPNKFVRRFRRAYVRAQL
jgi:CHAD domain-containing protein